jgi:hypothetical protein
LRHGPLRALHTIASIDEFARKSPRESVQGFLSVVVTEVKLLEYFRRKRLYSGECCAAPLYANTPRITCRACGLGIDLRLNPGLLAQVIDETGSISGGRLLFSDDAWAQLFGRPPAGISHLTENAIKDLADRLLFSRLTLLFGWTGDEKAGTGGRVCILGVQQ